MMVPPEGWAKADEVHCCGGGCGGVYLCAHCLRWCGWCFGAHDEIEAAMGPICDDCAHIETESHPRATELSHAP